MSDSFFREDEVSAKSGQLHTALEALRGHIRYFEAQYDTTMTQMRDLADRYEGRLRELNADAARPETGNGEWSEQELSASVTSYLAISRSHRDGTPLVKKAVYRDLAARFGRSVKSYEYRMQNISYVLQVLGRDWVPGLPPARNVGTKVAALIERLIAEHEGHPLVPRVEAEVGTAKLRQSLQPQPPVGNPAPTASVTNVTVYQRDTRIRAWVLENAKGACEACGEPAPFIGPNNLPFLEVHHVRQLADGGPDKIENAVALCPNCHRRLHYSQDAKAFRDGLYGRVSRLVRE